MGLVESVRIHVRLSRLLTESISSVNGFLMLWCSVGNFQNTSRKVSMSYEAGQCISLL